MSKLIKIKFGDSVTNVLHTLAGYAKKKDVDEVKAELDNKQDKLLAGSGIKIKENSPAPGYAIISGMKNIRDYDGSDASNPLGSVVIGDVASNVASGKYASAEGDRSIASGRYSHAEGLTLSVDGVIKNPTASGGGSHVEGAGAVASGDYSHAEGEATQATKRAAHAEGENTVASGTNSHAEGGNTVASGDTSHAEGWFTEASGVYSHSEGTNTRASGRYSHAEGYSTIASSKYQHAQGKFNIEDAADVYAHIVGNGASDSARSNAHTLDWDGNAWYAGKVTMGADPTANMDAVPLHMLNTELAKKQDKLVAGTNVQVAADGKTVSATDTTYAAGAGITISGANNTIAAERNATNTYTKEEVDTRIASASHGSFKKVDTLPATGEAGYIYLVPKISGGYEQYIWGDDGGTMKWIDIGGEDIDLSGYVTDTELTTALADKQDKLVAGDNIQIAANGKNISATDTTYTAGDGITITGANNTIAAERNASNTYTKTEVDTELAKKQDKIIAGTNVTIAADGKTINATDTTYTAGDGITISGANNAIAAERNASNTYTKTEVDNLLGDKQDELTAGNGIQISSANAVSAKTNSKNDDGIVPKGTGNNWKIYATNGSGVPSWNEGDAYRLRGITEIPANADLNDYKAVGNYYTASSAIARTILNAPITTTYRLIVAIYGVNATFVRQTLYSANDNRIFTRIFPPGTEVWSEWQDITKDTNTTYSAGTALDLSGTTFNVQLLNAFTQTDAGKKALDAMAGKTLNDRLMTVEGYFDTAVRTVGAGAGGAGGFKTIAYNASTLEAGGNFIMVNTSSSATDTLSNAFASDLGTNARLWVCMSYAPQKNLKYQIAILINQTIKAMAIRNQNWWNNTWSPWYVMTDYIKQYNVTLDTTYVGGTGQYVGVYKNPTSKIAQVEFSATFKSTYSSDNVAIIATGLPKPAKPDGGFVTLARGTAQYTPRVNVDNNGRLQPWYCGNVSGMWTGSFMYFYKD